MAQDSDKQAKKSQDFLEKKKEETKDKAKKGEVDTSDQESKADLAKTLGRTQQDGNRKAVYVDRKAEHKSLLAKDEEMEAKLTKTTDSDMKTPQDKEVPDALQPPEVDTKEEYDYNEDVAYLQKFGRA